jgi:CheY-like chemotaxis protein
MNSYDLSELNIVLAERSPLMRRLMRSAMRELGVQEVLAVANAEAAYERFKTATPDVIFTDWSPGLDGLGLIQQARTGEDSPNPYVPIVVVTAYTDLQHVVRARDSGINEYLAKPVSAKSIYSRICSLVEGERPFIRVPGFFGPDRRRRRIDHGGHERRNHANSRSANRRKKDIPFDHPEHRQGRPGYQAPERRQRKRLGVKNQEQKRVITGINDLVPA